MLCEKEAKRKPKMILSVTSEGGTSQTISYIANSLAELASFANAQSLARLRKEKQI